MPTVGSALIGNEQSKLLTPQRGQATTKNVKSMPLKHEITKFHKNKYVPIPEDTEDIEKK